MILEMKKKKKIIIQESSKLKFKLIINFVFFKKQSISKKNYTDYY